MQDHERRIAELQEEARLIRAWLRDVTEKKQARLRDIAAEIEALQAGITESEGGCSESQATVAQSLVTEETE